MVIEKIEIKNINMNYHSLKCETKALNNINFTVNGGEFLSIVGPSGCGKSTLLNIIAGLIHPSSGDIVIDGEKIDNISHKMGYMFQKDHLFDWLTVWDNVILGLKIQHNLTNESINKVTELLKNYNLYEFRNHKPKELSGGMRQRVALIRTLALSPEVLLLDEPFSALDYQTRLKVSDDIYKIIKHENKTVIMVTHDIAEAISMSNRVLILSKRPAILKTEVQINFKQNYNSPILCRKAPEFSNYFNTIWKELDINE